MGLVLIRDGNRDGGEVRTGDEGNNVVGGGGCCWDSLR